MPKESKSSLKVDKTDKKEKKPVVKRGSKVSKRVEAESDVSENESVQENSEVEETEPKGEKPAPAKNWEDQSDEEFDGAEPSNQLAHQPSQQSSQQSSQQQAQYQDETDEDDDEVDRKPTTKSTTNFNRGSQQSQHHQPTQQAQPHNQSGNQRKGAKYGGFGSSPSLNFSYSEYAEYTEPINELTINDILKYLIVKSYNEGKFQLKRHLEETLRAVNLEREFPGFSNDRNDRNDNRSSQRDNSSSQFGNGASYNSSSNSAPYRGGNTSGEYKGKKSGFGGPAKK